MREKGRDISWDLELSQKMLQDEIEFYTWVVTCKIELQLIVLQF